MMSSIGLGIGLKGGKMDKELTEGPPEGRKPTRSDEGLHQAETSFLQDSIRDLQTDLQEQFTGLAVSTDRDSLPEGQFELLARRQRLGRILRELLQTHERDRHSLETILDERLRRIHQQLSALEQTVEDRKAYDEAFWQLEHERQILEEILESWQRWSRGANIQQGKATE
jgi:hypothetical protein